MATIRVRDWTKERIEEIREAESHSSHDSVIKSLLKDRELAQFAGTSVSEAAETDEPTREEPADKAFDDLTVLAELVSADNGVLFLWCPSCGNEIAYLGVENPPSLSVFEVECQRCLTRLDQHAVVGIEIGYPIEERIVEGTLHDDLKACVVDYWDRTLARLGAGTLDPDVDVGYLVWEFDQYVREFGWEWPPDVPAIGIAPGRTYRHEGTGERIEVLERVSENRNALDDFRVRRHPPEDDPETTEMDAAELLDLVVARELSVIPPDREPAASAGSSG